MKIKKRKTKLRKKEEIGEGKKEKHTKKKNKQVIGKEGIQENMVKEEL